MTTKRKVLMYITVFIITALFASFVYNYREKLGEIIIPFFMATIVSYLLNPMVKRLKAKKIPCSISILLIYLFFSLLLTAIIIFIIPEVIRNTRDLMNTLPEITLKYQGMFNNFMSLIQTSNWPPDIKNAIFREVQNGIVIAQNYVMDTLKKSLSALVETITAAFDFVLAMIIAYYLIKDAEFFKESVLSLTPRHWRNFIINTGRQISLILSNFIQGQILTALMVGTMETIGLFIIKVKYPVVLGVVGGVANIIPYFGPILGAIPAVAVALIQSPVKALWTVLVFTIVQQIDNAFISPKIIEGRLGLHPVTTIVAVLVGGEFYGITGMLVAVPVVAVLKVILKNAVEAIV